MKTKTRLDIDRIAFIGRTFDEYVRIFDLDFHKDCLMELMRVSSGEVRIFPLHGLDAKPYRHLDEVISFLSAAALDAEITKVPFEFQRGGNKMMTIRRKK